MQWRCAWASECPRDPPGCTGQAAHGNGGHRQSRIRFRQARPDRRARSDGAGVTAQIPDISLKLNDLEQKVALRDSQLSALENVIIDRDLKKQIHPRAARNGRLHFSYFGEREDPFSGEEAYHKGVDFAGTAGANVMAVAAGV